MARAKTDREKQLVAEVDKVLEKCKVSPGFMIFVGVKTEKKDQDGNNIVDFNLIRINFGTDDLLLGHRHMQKMIQEQMFGVRP